MGASLRSATARVRVPATSANLGPGYDALGLALARYDEVTARVIDNGLHVSVAGEGADDVARDESHLVVQAMRMTFERLGVTPPGLAVNGINTIPHGRGLGSSAAAICAGVLLARRLVVDGDTSLDDTAVLALAGEIEGHPDNVAPCLLGGLTVAWTEPERGARAIRVEPAAGVQPVVLIPAFTSSTEQARRLLPAEVSHRDAAVNAGRAALLVAALTAHPDALLPATEDRLHQSYRAPAMPASADLVARLRARGIAAVISGAGPSVLALTVDTGQVSAVLEQVPTGWQGEVLPIAIHGALDQDSDSS